MGSWVDQIGDSKVVRARFLAEARAWNSHDTRLVDHFHAVDEVWLFALALGLVNKLLREVNLGEAVHGALDFSAGDLFHVIERVRQQLSSLFQSIKHSASLFLVLLNALRRLAAYLRRIHH